METKKFAKNLLFSLNRNPLYKILYHRNINKRARSPFTDILLLSKPIDMFAPYTNEIHSPNDWYGHAANLKKFLGLPKEYLFKFSLEHGLYLSDQVDKLDIEADLPTILTYSSYRMDILKKYRRYVFAIGPFIHYAESMLNKQEVEREHQKNGKTLLFFPAHSTPVIGINYDVKNLCRQIRKIGRGFDKIRVCIYWKDVLLGKHLYYLNQGFECVTAGHMLDPNFLPRLKSLILISDLTASNIISSQAGFCVYLNKPHILLKNKFDIKTNKEWTNRIREIFSSPGYIEVSDEFSKLNYKITKKQKELIKKYWGTDNVKTKTQLLKIVKLSEKYYSLKK